MLFHHDPLHADEVLDDLWAAARTGWTGSAATPRRSRWRWRAASSRSATTVPACPRLSPGGFDRRYKGSPHKFRHADNDRASART